MKLGSSAGCAANQARYELTARDTERGYLRIFALNGTDVGQRSYACLAAMVEPYSVTANVTENTAEHSYED